jgi:hypothetical protein
MKLINSSMNKQPFSLLLICLLFSLAATAQPAKTANTDSTQIRNSIMTFYNWYNKNYTKLQSFTLYTSIKKKEMPPYRINWKEAERYLNYLRTSVPNIGEEFITNQRIFFKQCDSAFKVDLEDEIPYGFDYDWYTNSQEEPQLLVDELKKSKQWVTTVKGNDATVDVLGFYMDNGNRVETVVMCFAMKKEKGKWKIAKIGCPYTDPQENKQ